MDPLSFTASLITLVQLTATVGKSAVKLYHDVKDAPQDLEQTSARVLRAQERVSTLVRVYHTQLSRPGFEGELLISPQDLTPLRISIQSAQTYLDDIQQYFTHFDNKLGKRASLRWTFRDKDTVTKLLQHLREIEGELNALLMIMQIVISTATYSSVNGISMKQDSIIERIQDLTIVEAVKEQSQAHAENPDNLAISTGSRTPTFIPPIYEDIGKISVSRPKIWGGRHVADSTCSKYGATSSVALNVLWNDLRSTYTISGSIRMPSLLSGYAVTVHARLDLFKLSWPSLAPAIRVRSVVPCGSKFMTACRDGDLAKVKQLAVARQGSPTDIDELGKPAFHHAVESGSCEVVKFLLYNGATANELWQIGHGSPLQLADTSPRVEFVQSLLSFSPFLTMNEDEDRSDPLYWAAQSGTAEDINLLIRSGASLHRVEDAMVKCIQRMDPAVYDSLVAYTPSSWINKACGNPSRVALQRSVQADCLHQNRVEMIKRLLAAGADVHIRDKNGWTVEDFAKANDRWFAKLDPPPRAFEAYVDALRSFGYDVSVDDEDDMVWPTNEDPPPSDENRRVTKLVQQMGMTLTD
ncbi:hypothetical protein MMC30_006819 [Trapelia coarctata]|nr:hypothetical protein [Trapelia coarctata]